MNQTIFQYNNGEEDVLDDPMVLMDQLMIESQGQLWDWLRKEQAIAAARDDIAVIMMGIEARRNLINCTGRAFAMIPFNKATGKGATPTHVLAVLVSFLHFRNQKKTRQEPQPTTSTPTESTSQEPTSVPMPITTG